MGLCENCTFENKANENKCRMCSFDRYPPKNEEKKNESLSQRDLSHLSPPTLELMRSSQHDTNSFSHCDPNAKKAWKNFCQTHTNKEIKTLIKLYNLDSYRKSEPSACLQKYIKRARIQKCFEIYSKKKVYPFPIRYQLGYLFTT